MEKYFAAANSAGGFVSWFDDIFAPEKFERIYLIKGGSGTGKSTLMKKIAKCANEKSFTCEYFYCSSDPDSLDGLIIKRENEGEIAFLDATAPHTRDPKIPGAVEEIVNLGEFWNEKHLIENRDEITDLIQQKSNLFTKGYDFLSSAGEFSKLLRSDTEKIINFTKMQAAADRLINQRMKSLHYRSTEFCKNSDVKNAIRGTSALSVKGIVQFDTFKNCRFACGIKDAMSLAEFMFDALIFSANRIGLEIVRSPSPLEPTMTNGIIIPKLEMSVVTYDQDCTGFAKIINMERFIDHGVIDQNDKNRRKILSKCKSELLKCALDEFSKVGEVHSKLESIYIKAMDFDALNKYTENFLARIFN